MNNITPVEYERFKALIHAETQIEMIKESIERMEGSSDPEEILGEIKATLRN